MRANQGCRRSGDWRDPGSARYATHCGMSRGDARRMYAFARSGGAGSGRGPLAAGPASPQGTLGTGRNPTLGSVRSVVSRKRPLCGRTRDVDGPGTGGIPEAPAMRPIAGCRAVTRVECMLSPAPAGPEAGVAPGRPAPPAPAAPLGPGETLLSGAFGASYPGSARYATHCGMSRGDARRLYAFARSGGAARTPPTTRAPRHPPTAPPSLPCPHGASPPPARLPPATRDRHPPVSSIPERY
jgi:hypothetical protein